LKLHLPSSGIIPEFRGEFGSKGNYLLNEGKYHAALNFFNDSLEAQRVFILCMVRD
jgi:hypothetical protein